MRAGFTARQTFVVALGAGLAVAVAPLGVEAAKRSARVAVDKKGRAKVVVVNRPAVRVKGGVAVSNEPNVKVTNRPTVEIGNQPTVTVANQPTDMSVKAAPGRLNATTRPPLDDIFNFHVADVQSLTARQVLTLPASRRAAVTNVSVTVQKFGSPVDAATIVDVIRYVRVADSNPCGQSGWTSTPLRRIVLKTDQTVALDLSGAPLVVGPDEGGAPVCVAMKLYQWVSDTKVSFAADGYLF